MRRYENEIWECEHNNPSDSESGMQPRYKEPCSSAICIPRSTQNHCMQLPLAGLIYMCDSKTRRLTLKRKIIYMPARKRWVNAARVRPGAKLFIFDYQNKLLWGIYEITTFPHFQRRGAGAYQEDDLPYQIYFQVSQRCEPLKEEVFRHAIQENYYTPQKFHFELIGDQVTNLLALFRLHTSYWSKKHQISHPRILEKRRFQGFLKFPAFAYETVSSEHKKHFRKHKHPVQLDNPKAKAKVQSISPIPQKKGYLLTDELLQCDLKLGRAERFLMDNSPACFQESLEQGDGDSSTYTPISLEDGEFVLPKGKEQYELNDTASVEEVDSDCVDAEYRTRNFIEILEHGLTSNSNTNSIHSSFSTADGEIIVAKNFDEANNPAHVGVKDKEASERAVWVESKIQGLLARTLGKRTRIPTAGPGLCTDGGNKFKRSVWLRLSDPRPMRTDHFFADEDVVELTRLQQCQFESICYGTQTERQSCLQRSTGFDRGYYSASKVLQESTNTVNSGNRRGNATQDNQLAGLNSDLSSLISNEQITEASNENSIQTEGDDTQKAVMMSAPGLLAGSKEASDRIGLRKEVDGSIRMGLAET